MALRNISRNIKMELLSDQGDIVELLFQYPTTQRACRLFLNELKKKGAMTRTELNQFAHDLKDRKIDPEFTYSRDRFYETIRKTLLTIGLMGIVTRVKDKSQNSEVILEPQKKHRRDTETVYVPTYQPISFRPPDGLNIVRLTWIIGMKWNKEFFNEDYLSEKKKRRKKEIK